MIFKPFFIWHKQKDWPNKKLIKLHPEQVMFLETVGNYTRIVLENDRYFEVRSSLTTALKKLPDEIFIKVHRSYAISILYIDTLEKNDVTIRTNSIPIARQLYKPLINKLNIIS